MKHIMIDIETAALTTNAAILSIGVAAFQPMAQDKIIAFHNTHAHFRVGRSSKWNVTLDSNRAQGLITQAPTLQWWDEQSKVAQNALFTPTQIPLATALQNLSRWMGGKEFMEDYLVWAGPSNFDLPILENAFRACGIEVPWHHRNTRCFVTLRDLTTMAGLLDTIGDPHRGTVHDAIWDAKYQAECAGRYMEKLAELEVVYDKLTNMKPGEAYAPFRMSSFGKGKDFHGLKPGDEFHIGKPGEWEAKGKVTIPEPNFVKVLEKYTDPKQGKDIVKGTADCDINPLRDERIVKEWQQEKIKEDEKIMEGYDLSDADDVQRALDDGFYIPESKHESR